MHIGTSLKRHVMFALKQTGTVRKGEEGFFIQGGGSLEGGCGEQMGQGFQGAEAC